MISKTIRTFTVKKLSILSTFLVMMLMNIGIAQEIGIQLYSLRNQFSEDIPSTLKLIKSWGIGTIEGGENTYGMEEGEFIALIRELDFKVACVGTSLGELEKEAPKALKRAKAFGAKYVMCPWIPHNGNEFTIKDVKHAVEVFNKAGALFREQGVNLVYHPHGYEFRPYGEGTLFDYMVGKAEHFDFELDVYWAQHGSGDAVALFEKYPDRFKLMHMKDMAKGVVGNNTGQTDVETNVVIGTGQIDIKSLVRLAKENGVDYMFIEDESSRVVEQVPQSLEYLKKL